MSKSGHVYSQMLIITYI